MPSYAFANWQRSNVRADWAKNPDKPPIFENPPGRPDKGQKRGRVRGNPDVYGNPMSIFSILVIRLISFSRFAQFYVFLFGCRCISYTLHAKDGRTLYTRNDFVDVSSQLSTSHRDVVKIGGYNIANVYKPPTLGVQKSTPFSTTSSYLRGRLQQPPSRPAI